MNTKVERIEIKVSFHHLREETGLEAPTQTLNKCDRNRNLKSNDLKMKRKQHYVICESKSKKRDLRICG